MLNRQVIVLCGSNLQIQSQPLNRPTAVIYEWASDLKVISGQLLEWLGQTWCLLSPAQDIALLNVGGLLNLCFGVVYFNKIHHHHSSSSSMGHKASMRDLHCIRSLAIPRASSTLLRCIRSSNTGSHITWRAAAIVV